MSFQIAVRIPESLVKALDALVKARRFPTRADAVRFAIESMVSSDERRRIGARIADGYRRHPQTDDEVAAARAAAIRSIHEEPW